MDTKVYNRIDATRNLLLIIIVCLAIRYSNSFKMRRIQNAQFKTFEKQGQGDRKKKKEKKNIMNRNHKKNNIKLINFSTLYVNHRNTYTFQNCPVINVLINHIRILMTFSLTNACKKNVVTRSCCGKYRSPLYYKEKKRRERKREKRNIVQNATLN